MCNCSIRGKEGSATEGGKTHLGVAQVLFVVVDEQAVAAVQTVPRRDLAGV